MTCQELQDGYELYVFGTLEDPERSEIQAHLERACPTCTEGVAKARRLSAHVALAAPQVEPSPRLRATILESLGPSPAESAPRAGALWKWAFAASAVAVLALLLISFDVDRQARSLERELATVRDTWQKQRQRERQLLAQLAAYRQALRLITEPGAREIRFGPQQPAGRVYLQPGGVVLIATDLPQPPKGRTYELWLISSTRPAPIPAGVFMPDASGHAIHVWQEAVEVGAVKAIAVSDEPPGGVPAPTGKIILTVPVQ